MNLVGPLLHFGRTRPTSPALVEGNRTITYGELADLMRRTVWHLATLGLRRGDRIGLCLKDTSEHVVALLAVALMGGVAVPLDWRARPVENARFVDGLGLACVLAEADSRLTDGCPVVVLDAEWHRAVARANVGGELACHRRDVRADGTCGTPSISVQLAPVL